MRSQVMVCTTHRGSRRRSSAFFERHIIPRYTCPSTRSISHGLMRGEPSDRSVPSITTSSFLKRSPASEAIWGQARSNSAHLTPSPEHGDVAGDQDHDADRDGCDHPRHPETPPIGTERADLRGWL